MDADTEHLESWRKRVEKELAGAAFDTLRTPLGAGLVMEPLYTDASGGGHVATVKTTLAAAGSVPSDTDGLIDLRPWEASGLLAAGVLGRALGALVARLRAGALQRVVFAVPVGTDLLLEIAKLRALRRLVAKVFEACLGVQDFARPAVVVHAFASPRQQSACDLPTSLIWNSAAVFASITGGADFVTPFLHAGGDPEARRLTDNVVRLALYEAHLDAVADPAAGSYAFEALTEGLCEGAWTTFQELERSATAARP